MGFWMRQAEVWGWGQVEVRRGRGFGVGVIALS